MKKKTNVARQIASLVNKVESLQQKKEDLQKSLTNIDGELADLNVEWNDAISEISSMMGAPAFGPTSPVASPRRKRKPRAAIKIKARRTGLKRRGLRKQARLKSDKISYKKAYQERLNQTRKLFQKVKYPLSMRDVQKAIGSTYSQTQIVLRALSKELHKEGYASYTKYRLKTP